MRKIGLLAISILLFTVVLVQAQEKKLALVIGNSIYDNGQSLKNPANDADLIAKTLKSLGFEVEKLVNATLEQMQSASLDFNKKISKYNVVLFYYAGHGVQVEGENYLIPTDAELQEKLSVRYEAFNISDINYAFRRNSSAMNIMILDACRDNPFRSWARGGEKGFKAVSNQAAGTIIAFATREGETAGDGIGNNGLYTSKLVEQINIPQSLTDVFQNTRVEVLKESNNSQCPQEWNMMTKNFYFIKGVKKGLSDSEHIEAKKGACGTLILNTLLKGNLYIDDIMQGYMTRGSMHSYPNINKGSHSAKIKNNGKIIWQDTFNIYEKQSTNLTAKLQIKRNKYNVEKNKRFEFTERVNGVSFKMLGIEGGKFQMGCNDCDYEEKPVHTVTVGGFYIGETEVTQALWKAVMGNNPSHYSGDNNPVETVSWQDVQKFIVKLNNKTKKNYRLPTEAEWEYAAGGGSKHQKWAGTDNQIALKDYAWYYENSFRLGMNHKNYGTNLVKGKRPNKYGIYDMTGNVQEFCSDIYDENYYNTSPDTNPVGPLSGTLRVIRGGSWSHSDVYCSVANRSKCNANNRSNYIGFRIVLGQ